MVRRALVVLCIAFITVFMASCGQTYKLQSLTVTPGAVSASGNQQITLLGIGAYQQLTVTATFSNMKTQDVTNAASYAIYASLMPSTLNPAVAVPLTSVSLSPSGKLTVITKACTFDTEPIPGSSNTDWTYFSYPYKAHISYTNNGVTASTDMDVNVINSRYCWDGTDVVGGNAAKPFAGFTGNLAQGWGN